MCGIAMLCQDPNCNARLMANAKYCSLCGQAVNETAQRPQPNRYVRDVKQQGKNYDEHTEFCVSDHAVDALAPFIVGHAIRPTARFVARPASHNGSDASLETLAITGDLFDQAGAVNEADAPTPDDAPAAPKSLRAAQFFRIDGDCLVGTSEGYKGKDWKEQQCRFILSYAAAYEQYFNKPVPEKKHFTTVAQKAKVYDRPNFAKYLTGLIGGPLTEASNGIFVNDAGNAEVQRIVTEMNDPQVDKGFTYWNRTAADKVERHRLSSAERDQIKQWAQEEVDLGKLELRDLKSPRDYAILGIWILTIHLHKAEAVRWNAAYYFYKEKGWPVSAKPDEFSTTLKRKGHENLFRASDSGYFLTQEAIMLVDGWRSGKPVIAPKDDKDD